MKQVYLAGPITGLTFEGCTDWRDYAIASLADNAIKGLSPMRAKEFLKHLGPLPAEVRDRVVARARQMGAF